MSFTDGSASTSPSGRTRQISTIGEAFYNALGAGSFMSDDEHSHHSHSSSDVPIPYLSPQKEASTSSSSIQMAAAYLGQQDTSLLSEGSSGSKDSVGGADDSDGEEARNEDEAQFKSEGTNRSRDVLDISYGEDAPRMPDRSRDKKANGDILARSDRSNVRRDFRDNSMQSGASRNVRDTSTGYDSLLVSEASDDSLRGVVNFAGDEDNSSISSTRSNPFPLLEEEDEDESSDDSKSEKQEEVIENSPLVSRSAPSAPDPSNIEEITAESENGDNDEQDVKDTGPAEAKSDAIRVSETTAPTEVNNNSNADYNGSISTRNSLQISERAGRIPRLWIIDRIDGTVKPEEEELPQWRQKPPFFLCLPSPLLSMFPRFFEENSFCTKVGSWGFFGGDTVTSRSDRSSKPGDIEESNDPFSFSNETSGNSNNFLRTLIIGHSLLFNACGLFATILSGLALTRQYPSLLKSAPFGKTIVIPTLSSPTGDSDGAVDIFESVTLYLGLLSLGVYNPTHSDNGILVVGFRDFCTTTGTEQFVSTENCDRCAHVSMWIVVGYFLAMLAYLPSFSVSVSRFYRNYDTNCSKVSAGIWSLVSILGYVIVLSCYSSCLNSLYEGEVLYTNEGAFLAEDNVFRRNDSNDEYLVANFDWKMGVGQILFIIGLFLKLLDFTCNCCIATPAITRSRELQWDYEEECLPVVSRTQGEEGANGNPQEQARN